MAQQSNNKAQAQQFHAISRLRQRYGLHVSCDEYFRIVKRIRNINYMVDASLRPRFLSKQSNRVSIWCVPYEGKELVAVYRGGTP